jgi:hypothetical protein
MLEVPSQQPVQESPPTTMFTKLRRSNDRLGDPANLPGTTPTRDLDRYRPSGSSWTARIFPTSSASSR